MTLIQDVDTFYLLFSAYLVFFMQCGFAMLSAGSVRSKNAKNIILKNLLDACFGAFGWYITGYALAYGDEMKVICDNGNCEAVNDGNGFIGTKFFALYELPRDQFASWFFQFAFAATAATIVAGAVAERMKFQGYICYATFLTMFVYPVVVHWVWSGSGWASAFRDSNVGDRLVDVGAIDFAGCGVVHMVGGLAAFAGALVLGPRKGRFDGNGKPLSMPGHSTSLAVLGVFILWFGWYGFNPGSTLLIFDVSNIAATCALNTTLAAAGGTVVTLILAMIHEFIYCKRVVWDLVMASNGTLAGLVSITASCAIVKPWAALAIGAFGGVVYFCSSGLMLHLLQIDDPLDAVSVHGSCGMWGLIAAGLFAAEEEMRDAYGTTHYGPIMGGGWNILAANTTILAAITGWVLALMIPFFLILRVLGQLRVSYEEEHDGLDISHHGGKAYNSETTPVTLTYAANHNFAEQIRVLQNEVAILKGESTSTSIDVAKVEEPEKKPVKELVENLETKVNKITYPKVDVEMSTLPLSGIPGPSAPPIHPPPPVVESSKTK